MNDHREVIEMRKQLDWISDEIKTSLQPLVDTFVRELVRTGQMNRGWAAMNSLDPCWHYVALKCLWHTDDDWLPADPRWEKVVALAVERRIETGTKRILPNSTLWAEVFRAHRELLPELPQERSEAVLEDQRRRDREAVQKLVERAENALERIRTPEQIQEIVDSRRQTRAERHAASLRIAGYSEEEIKEIVTH